MELRGWGGRTCRSHSMAVPSLPPDAHSDPSGDTVTQLRYLPTRRPHTNTPSLRYERKEVQRKNEAGERERERKSERARERAKRTRRGRRGCCAACSWPGSTPAAPAPRDDDPVSGAGRPRQFYPGDSIDGPLSLSLSLSLTDKYGGSSKGARRPEKQTAPAPPSSAWSRGLCVEGSWGSDGGRALIVAGGGWRGVGERGRRGVP